jgi:hypothetical protein
MRLPALICVLVFCVVFIPGAAAHHSAAAYDTQTEVTLEGTVTRWSWRNPHVYMNLEIPQADGSTLDVEIEAGSSSVLIPLGVASDSVQVGDRVTVTGNPARRSSDAVVLGRELVKADGTYVPLHIASRSIRQESDAVATSIAGTWFSSVGSFSGFLRAASSWALTEAGEEVSGQSTMDSVQANCVPIAIPGLMHYPVADTIRIEDDRVVINIDWMSSERIVYLDGRDHPDASEQFMHGHSVGHWEGDTLVVDTANFTEHPAGLSSTLRGSAQKHLIERFSLSEDGRSLDYSGYMEDPVYLADRVEWDSRFAFTPDMQPSNEACDLEIARRFLEQ